MRLSLCSHERHDYRKGNNTTEIRRTKKTQPVTRASLECDRQLCSSSPLFHSERLDHQRLDHQRLDDRAKSIHKAKKQETSVQGNIKYRSGERFGEPQQ